MVCYSKTEEKKNSVPEPAAAFVDAGGTLHRTSTNNTRWPFEVTQAEIEEGDMDSPTSQFTCSDDAEDEIRYDGFLLANLELSAEAAARQSQICLVLAVKLWPLLKGGMADWMDAYKRFSSDLRECVNYNLSAMRGKLDSESRVQEFHTRCNALWKIVVASDPQLRQELAEMKATMGLDMEDDRHDMECLITVIEKILKDYDCSSE